MRCLNILIIVTIVKQRVRFEVSDIWKYGSVLAAACPSMTLHGKAKAGRAAVKTLLRYRTEQTSLIIEMALIRVDTVQKGEDGLEIGLYEFMLQ